MVNLMIFYLCFLVLIQLTGEAIHSRPIFETNSQKSLNITLIFWTLQACYGKKNKNFFSLHMVILSYYYHVYTLSRNYIYTLYTVEVSQRNTSVNKSIKMEVFSFTCPSVRIPVAQRFCFTDNSKLKFRFGKRIRYSTEERELFSARVLLTRFTMVVTR